MSHDKLEELRLLRRTQKRKSVTTDGGLEGMDSAFIQVCAVTAVLEFVISEATFPPGCSDRDGFPHEDLETFCICKITAAYLWHHCISLRDCGMVSRLEK